MKASFLEQSGCLACRIGLAWTIGDVLVRRVELNIPLHSFVSVQEALFWTSVGRSPFTSSIFRGPPLLLSLTRLCSSHVVLQATLLSLIDWITANILSRVAAVVDRQDKLKHSEHTLVRQSAAILYLVNPCLILSSAAGSAASFANLSVASALYGALIGTPALAALGIAMATYLSAHPLLLLVPTTLLLRQSVKTQHSTSYAVTVQASANASDTEPSSADKQQALNQAQHTAANQICLQFIACFGLFLTCLLLLSDIQLSSYSDHFTTTVFSQSQINSKGRSTLPLGASKPMHWTRHVYEYMILGPDSSPNIGMWWYFFAEVFPSWKAPLKALFGFATVIPPLLLTIKLHQNPLLLFLCQCIVNSMLKPYPTAADAAQFMAFLPLFPELLVQLPSAVFSASSLLMLAYLGPTMWYLWMDAGTGNANFFYAITLLWGAWQAMLLLQLLSAAIEPDDSAQEPQKHDSHLQQPIRQETNTI